MITFPDEVVMFFSQFPQHHIVYHLSSLCCLYLPYRIVFENFDIVTRQKIF